MEDSDGGISPLCVFAYLGKSFDFLHVRSIWSSGSICARFIPSQACVGSGTRMYI